MSETIEIQKHTPLHPSCKLYGPFREYKTFKNLLFDAPESLKQDYFRINVKYMPTRRLKHIRFQAIVIDKLTSIHLTEKYVKFIDDHISCSKTEDQQEEEREQAVLESFSFTEERSSTKQRRVGSLSSMETYHEQIRMLGLETYHTITNKHTLNVLGVVASKLWYNSRLGNVSVSTIMLACILLEPRSVYMIIGSITPNMICNLSSYICAFLDALNKQRVALGDSEYRMIMKKVDTVKSCYTIESLSKTLMYRTDQALDTGATISKAKNIQRNIDILKSYNTNYNLLEHILGGYTKCRIEPVSCWQLCDSLNSMFVACGDPRVPYQECWLLPFVVDANRRHETGRCGMTRRVPGMLYAKLGESKMRFDLCLCCGIDIGSMGAAFEADNNLFVLEDEMLSHPQKYLLSPHCRPYFTRFYMQLPTYDENSHANNSCISHQLNPVRKLIVLGFLKNHDYPYGNVYMYCTEPRAREMTFKEKYVEQLTQTSYVVTSNNVTSTSGGFIDYEGNDLISDCSGYTTDTRYSIITQKVKACRGTCTMIEIGTKYNDVEMNRMMSSKRYHNLNSSQRRTIDNPGFDRCHPIEFTCGPSCYKGITMDNLTLGGTRLMYGTRVGRSFPACSDSAVDYIKDNIPAIVKQLKLGETWSLYYLSNCVRLKNLETGSKMVVTRFSNMIYKGPPEGYRKHVECIARIVGHVNTINSLAISRKIYEIMNGNWVAGTSKRGRNDYDILRY